MVYISGKVIRGEGYGRKLGFPTVNLQADMSVEELPSSGVYAGFAKLMSNTECLTFRAGIVIGPETNGQKKVEAHLIGYDGDAYGKMVTLEVGKFIREFKKFDTEEELIIQIKKDIEILAPH
jgi:FAD synthase